MRSFFMTSSSSWYSLEYYTYIHTTTTPYTLYNSYTHSYTTTQTRTHSATDRTPNHTSTGRVWLLILTHTRPCECAPLGIGGGVMQHSNKWRTFTVCSHLACVCSTCTKAGHAMNVAHVRLATRCNAVHTMTGAMLSPMRYTCLRGDVCAMCDV